MSSGRRPQLPIAQCACAHTRIFVKFLTHTFKKAREKRFETNSN